MGIKRGKILCLEGTDGSGKETQSKLLVERLRYANIPVEFMTFPRYDLPAGKIIGECYLGKDLGLGTGRLFGDPDKLDPLTAILYYAADRRYCLPEINSYLDNGINLVLDRYVPSNQAHQAGKSKSELERDEIIKKIEKLEYELLELPRPDEVIFLYLPAEFAIKKSKERAEKQGEKLDGHESNEEHIRNAEKVYLNLAKRYNWKRINCLTQDGRRKEKLETADEIYKFVRNSGIFEA